ncbi:Zinc finger protein 277 [Tupaia chinensis]|uniref:Zinc finger protein 277 n=1 Tax=Tupaia chinensis TaxID=246437 RepID=L9KSD7_TUPCH|nr:Zinc finger protein 277 [Tupaia chinensis]
MKSKKVCRCDSKQHKRLAWHRNDCILEPLSLPESPGGSTALEGSPSVPCIFCEEHFPVTERDKLLKHMIIEHKIVIADVKLVADFQRRDKSTFYWGMEKRRIRKEILEKQQQERNDTNFRGICMFCNEEFLGNRSVLLNHMAREHAFNIGLPDNIVNCNEFLCTLQKKLDNLQCLYCEKTFRDKNTLKDHMRKKQHRKINPKNREYDRFYVINYLELGKSWEDVQLEDDRELLDHQEDDWSDWEEHPVSAVCLFCEKQAETIEKLYVHMEDAHEFDLLKIKSELGLNFYQQVKLVNFIRRQVHQCRCYGCHVKFKSKADLRMHMEETKHVSLLPERKMWDQLEYYFPTYENDSLLCTLSDSESDLTTQEQNENVPIISEDTAKLHALKQSSILNQLLLQECLKN